MGKDSGQVWWDVVAEEVPLARWREGYASVTELWLVGRSQQKEGSVEPPT